MVLGEAGSLALALVMRLMGKLEGRYENLELEEVNRLHDMELQGIHKNMTSAQKVTNKNEDRLVYRRAGRRLFASLLTATGPPQLCPSFHPFREQMRSRNAECGAGLPQKCIRNTAAAAA